MPAHAEERTLQTRIAALFNQNELLPPEAHPDVSLRLLTPPAQLATLCATPSLSLSGRLNRLSGMHSVIAQCGTRRHFIQVSLDITATWWQATRAIPPGQSVTREDIRPQRGSLAHAPNGLIFEPARIVGRIAQRTVNPGEPLVERQLRPQWMIKAGQKVDMTYIGNGFRISATGKALDNAALNASFRIQSASGQIVTATAIAPGKASIAADQER
ncbi:flagellar basal body P-ring formation chaperone FlgA [Pantoea sp. KPR_PJ]|uniref:flagellar basal body P-ring formation chaperone FlgA n=1 Tax=Pantoea sp. KPR_PJ TaxID=2738375 RepID=UPI0035295803